MRKAKLQKKYQFKGRKRDPRLSQKSAEKGETEVEVELEQQLQKGKDFSLGPYFASASAWKLDPFCVSLETLLEPLR